MARSRNIKPGFFTNEVLAECGPWARLCFAGLWLLADRDGRLEDRPKRIKGELFRFDSIDVEPLLDELQAHGFLVRYRNAAGRFIQILAFGKHQTPHYSEKDSVIEPPSLQEIRAIMPPELPEDSKSSTGADPASRGGRNPLIPDSLIPDSGFLIPEQRGSAAVPAPPPPRAAPLRAAPPPTPPPAYDGNNTEALNGKAVVAIAAEFELPDAWGLDAEALGWKPAQVLREAEKFRQYWVSGKGAGTRRSVRGWRQSWSTWLEKAAKEQR